MRSSKRKKTVKLLICMLMAACLLVLPGCRESTALVQIIHDQKASEVDYESDQKIVHNEENTGNEDEQLVKKQETKDSKKTEQTKKVASARGEERMPGETSRSRYSDESPDSDNTAGDPDKGKKPDNNNDKGKDDRDDDDGSNNDGDKDDEEGTKGPSSKGREVYDNDGNVVELPKNVNSVVAAGDAGIIAQMLGGKGVLTGTSSSVKNNALAVKVFASMGISDSISYWNGDGDSPMSASSFNKLIKKKPDCCLAISGSSSFSSSQIATLKKKKIAYVTLASLNTADGIEKTVSIVGEVIGNRSSKGGNNARKMAKDYSKYCAGLVKKVKNAAGGLFTYNNTDYNNDYNKNGFRSATSRNKSGKYTLYISGWDAGKFTLSAAGKAVFTANGYPVTPNGYSRSPMSYYMSVGGVCNYAANLGESRCTTYAAIPVNINTLTPSVTGSAGYYRQRNESFASVNMGSDDSRINLGSSQYDSVVTDSSSTASRLKNSYMWKNHGKATLDSITDYGFVSSDGSTLIHSYIEGDYDIYVNPAGVMSWTEGSVESVLEAPWAAYRIHGGYSESAFRDDVKEFYSRFYGYDLSSSELSSIISGK